VSKAGGFGVLGAVGFSPEQLEIECAWIDEHVGDAPYGVDVVIPGKYEGQGEMDPDKLAEQLRSLVPAGHIEFAKDVLSQHGVPELPDDGLPRTWSSPTLSAACPDEVKYDVAERVRGRIEQIAAAGGTIAGRPIADLVTVNGIRVVADDGTWGLVRASSNKPELVVVVESPVSEARMRAMFSDIDAILRENSEVGAYNQAI
jgi:hypothetical protein